MAATAATRQKMFFWDWNKFQQLNWRIPYYPFLSHGYAGVCSLLCGIYLIYCSQFQSTLAPFGTHLPYQYVFFTVLNAVGGYQIAHRAPRQFRSVFRACSIVQCVFCYYIIRFLPTFYTRIPNVLLRFMDCAMVIPFMSYNAVFLNAAYIVSKENAAIAIAPILGVLATATTFAYPIHLVYDSQWLNCILSERYPAEDITLVAYVYLPATMGFSWMIFCATLHQHKVLSDFGVGVMAMLATFGIILMAVLMQEFQLSIRSGQQLIMPCPMPAEGTFWYRLDRMSDPRDNLRAMLAPGGWVQEIFHFLGIVPITDHTSYRPVSVSAWYQ
jgi:hypothetical protein